MSEDSFELLLNSNMISDIIEFEDIPNIDLYMDQVTTFIDANLENYKRDTNDKILTKTMINNYAKAKIFPPPLKKKYTRNHIMILIIIYHLKSILSINDIDKLLKPITNNLKSNEDSKFLTILYKNFIALQKKEFSISDNKSAKPLNLDGIETKDMETTKHILSVFSLAIESNSKKRLAEKIVDGYF